jgi:proteasome accessory factor C
VQEPTAQLTPTDALRLMLLVETGAAVLPAEEVPALQSIKDRLREALPASAAVDLAGLEHVELDTIKHAIRDGQLVQFQYKGRKDPTWRDREVAPTRLMVANGAVYLFGIDVHAGEERNFRLDRLTNVELAGPVPPMRTEAPSPAYVPTEEEVEVVLLLSTKATWIVTQVTPDASARTDDGDVVVVVRTDAVDWLLSHVMAAGGEAEVVAPPQLRDRVRERAEHVIAAIDARLS